MSESQRATWRSAYYFRYAKLLPISFALTGVLIFLWLPGSVAHEVRSKASPMLTGGSPDNVPRPAASQSLPASTATALVSAHPAVSASIKGASAGPAESPVDSHDVISYLGELINWYRHLDVEERMATDPAETLYFAYDRQNAGRVLDLGFEYASAAARLIEQQQIAAVNAQSPSPGLSSHNPAATPVNSLEAMHAKTEAAAVSAKTKVEQLQAALRRVARKQRDGLTQQLATAKAELDLAQSRADSLTAMIAFQNGTGANGKSGAELDNQIDQLKATVMPVGDGKAEPFTSPTSSSPAAHADSPASGMIGQAETLIALTQKRQSLDETVDLTQQLATTIDQLRKPLAAQLRQINDRATALQSSSVSNDIAVLRAARSQVEELTRRHRLIVAALLPLSKQEIVLQQYADNLERWRAAVGQSFTANLRELLIRIAGLVLLLLAITTGVALWRRLTFRYVRDLQRRRQLVQLSRILAVVIIALVLLFDFANQLGELATVMGFAAAGIALTLQNVILSLAGYFYVSGRYGIRVGDRVQISGISGDVLEIGLFKMTLMQLGNAESGNQPTGQVVVFPNSVVFQPNGNFSKQLPGSNFTWNELNLSLAPDCDYRLAERRLLSVINEVFSREREAIQHECRRLERDLNMRIEPPIPQSHLRLSDRGIELMIRYPAQLRSAVSTSDEVARRLVDAIKREPALKLVSQLTPAIQAVELDGLQTTPGALVSSNIGTAVAANPPEVLPGVTDQGAAMAAAAAAGATVAGALVETGIAEQKREGVGPPYPKS